MQISLGKHNLALGLEWTYSPTLAEYKQLLTNLPKAEQRAYRVVINDKASGETWMGFTESAIQGKVHAALAMIALVEPNAIISQQINDTQCWIGVTSDGKPSPGYDRVVPLSIRTGEIQQWMSLFGRHKLIGDQQGSFQTLEQVFTKLDETVSIKEIKHLVLRKPPALSTGVLLIGLLVALMVVGYAAFQFYKQQIMAQAMKREATAKLARATQDAKQLEAARQEIARAYSALVDAKRAELLAMQNSGQFNNTWYSWNSFRNTLPLSYQGYVPTTMKCTASSCDVTWDARGRYINVATKSVLSGRTETDITRSHMVSYPIQVRVSETSKKATVYTSASALRFDLTSRLQLANSPAILKVNEPVPVVVPLPPNAAQSGLKPVNAGAVGNLTISLTGATAMVSVLSVIEILNSYALQPVAVKWSSLNQSPSIEIEASFAIVNQ